LPFTAGGLSCGDDPDHPCAVVVNPIDKNNHDNGWASQTDSDPAIFPVSLTGIQSDEVWAFEQQRRSLETDAMFPDIAPVLSFIPFE
jgi:hypothetical protein